MEKFYQQPKLFLVFSFSVLPSLLVSSTRYSLFGSLSIAYEIPSRVFPCLSNSADDR